ncbi:MAG: hypothetical protein OXU20_21050 [Myxococcales bacterium]|nr:hypothetical protein [Myxococcales bacterium]
MAFKNLPTPRLARPIPLIDPYRHREAFTRLLGILYHAEAAAMEGFQLLTDPAYVQGYEIFDKVAPKLVEDERRHLGDIEDLVARLTDKGVPPPTPVEAEFWNGWRSGRIFALPYPPAIASLFCLFSEGLGYSFLYHLANNIAEPDFRDVLWANVEDEKTHLRLSLTVLRRAMGRDRSSLLANFLVYLLGYGLLARRPLREQRATMAAVGLDPEAMFGSMLSFVCELLLMVVDSDVDPRVASYLSRVSQVVGNHPELGVLFYAGMHLPEPPGLRRLIYGWGQLGHWRNGVDTTNMSDEVVA